MAYDAKQQKKLNRFELKKSLLLKLIELSNENIPDEKENIQQWIKELEQTIQEQKQFVEDNQLPQQDLKWAEYIARRQMIN